MKTAIAASFGMVIAGPLGALFAGLVSALWPRLVSRRPTDTPITVVLLLLLVELRSGLSVLAALVSVSASLPGHNSLRNVSRVAQVSGLVASLPYADDPLRPVITQLARAQSSGASLSGVVSRILENELAAERARRIARARTLPVRLMIPVTLLMLPGLILLLYAPSLLGMFKDLTGVF